jgi:LemA protein
MLRRIAGLLAVLVTVLLSGCGYNDLQRQDETIMASWSEVLNQYQRRADLVPNLVNTVKGYAQQEQQVLTEVTNARAQVGAIRATPELINDPVAFQKFIQAQNQLQSALSRLIAVSENYPQLKSDALFRDLQSQLEGTENRIAVARNRYIKSVQEFNTTVRQFPTNLTAMIFKMNVKPNFTVADEGAVSTPPKVDFGKPAAPPAPAPGASGTPPGGATAPPSGATPGATSAPPSGVAPGPAPAPSPAPAPKS